MYIHRPIQGHLDTQTHTQTYMQMYIQTHTQTQNGKFFLGPSNTEKSSKQFILAKPICAGIRSREPVQGVQLCLLSFSLTALVEALMSTAAKAVQEGRMEHNAWTESSQRGEAGWVPPGAPRLFQGCGRPKRGTERPVSQEPGSLSVVGTWCSGPKGEVVSHRKRENRVGERGMG